MTWVPDEWNASYWLKQNPDFKSLPINERYCGIRCGSSVRQQGLDRNTEPIIKSKNIHLYTYANVTEIRTNDSVSSVTEVIAKNYAGKEHKIRAKYFVIACCSVQNARLLLASNHQAPNGLGNDNDLVGRYFMEHLEMKSAEFWLKDPDQLSFYMWKWAGHPRAELALSEEQQTIHKVLNGTASLVPLKQGRQCAHLSIYTKTIKKDQPEHA